MEIVTYREEYKQQIIDLILHIQNDEAGIGLSIEEQPDLLDIPNYYQKCGGEFWIAVEDNRVIGTIALMNYENGNAVLKKFFVNESFRKQKIGYRMFLELMQFASNNKIHTILLDTPSVAAASHKFYKRAGFKRINKYELPFSYSFPDRDSYLYCIHID